MVTRNLMSIGFLGIGQCGGNITEIAGKYGYRTAAINTSVEDLNTLEFVREKKLINNNGGCGKNRNEGIEVVKKNYKDLITFIEETFSRENLIFVVFSTGGGTGSGFTPILMDIVSKKLKDKKFVLIGIMPSNSEGYSALDNNIECLRELHRLKLTTMLVDNEKFISANKDKKDLRKKDIFELINNYVVSNINIIFNSDLNTSSKYGNMDKKDTYNLFKPSGMMVISKKYFTKEEVKLKGMEQIVLSCIDDNIYADINKNGIISSLGVIYEVPTSLMLNVDYSKVSEEFGTPIDIFEGFREVENNGAKDKFKVIVIMSGLSFPKERINEYCTIVEDEGKNIIEDDEEDMFSSFKKDRKSLSNKRNSYEKKEEITSDDFDLESLFSDYD